MKARPTLYRGIRMRSRLEAHVARWLDTHPDSRPWEYEPTCFAGIIGQYLPDFVIHHPTFDSYIEVKPLTVGEEELEDTKRCMPVIWESQPRALLAIQLWDQRWEPPRLSISLHCSHQRPDRDWSVNVLPWVVGGRERFVYAGPGHFRQHAVARALRAGSSRPAEARERFLTAVQRHRHGLTLERPGSLDTSTA
jgi:hypothetical protein